MCGKIKFFPPPCLSSLSYFTSCSTFFNPQQPFLRGKTKVKNQTPPFPRKKGEWKRETRFFYFYFSLFPKVKSERKSVFSPTAINSPLHFPSFSFRFRLTQSIFPEKERKDEETITEKLKLLCVEAIIVFRLEKKIDATHVYFLFSPISLACCTCDLWVLVFFEKMSIFSRFWRSFLE